MTNQSTIDKLIERHLTTMTDAFRNQLDDPKFKLYDIHLSVSYSHVKYL